MKNLHLIFLCCLPLLGKAQLTITQENSPQIGDKLVYLVNNSSALSPGGTGQGQVWDFTSFIQQQTQTVNAVDPANVGYRDSFPDANLVFTSNSGTSFTYALTTDSAFFTLGAFVNTGDTATSLLTILNPPRKEIQYPTVFGTTFETSLSNVRDYGEVAPGTSFITVEKSEVLSQADGEGTLKLAQGDFSVLRIKVTSNRVDSNFLLSDAGKQFISATSSQTISYEWHAAEARGPLATLDMGGLGSNTSVVSILDLEASRLGDTSEVVVVAPIAKFDTLPINQANYFFLDLSENEPILWNWDFGDGTTSTMPNVQHQYQQGGTYQACLTVSNSAGTDSTCKQITIERLKPEAQFSYIKKEAGKVEFQNLSTGDIDNFLWNFGDGNVSSEVAPTHQFMKDGTFRVCLTASNSFGSDSTCLDLIIDNILPTANFTFANTAPGLFAFTNLSSSNTDSLNWDFGDGNTSQEINPAHQYAAEGAFMVCLIASNELGKDTICKTVLVSNLLPRADFSYEESSPGLFSYTDNSLNTPESWSWDFGDGNTSTAQNPIHQFSREGTFNTCLIAENTFGADTTCERITVSGLRTSAGFDIEQIGQGLFRFANLSSMNSLQFSWDFGDGGTSEGRTPEHQFMEEGFFTVCLIASNNFYSDTLCTVVEVAGLVPQAGFVVTEIIADSIQLMDTSNNFPTEWLWTFGDSTSSTLQNPGHTYTASGSYEVCLTAKNNFGQDSTCQMVAVIFTGTQSSLIEQGLDIMPNPFREQLNINWTAPEGKTAWRYRIQDASGRTIQQGRLLDSQSWDTHYWPSGLYWLQIIGTNRQSKLTLPIIKQ